MEISITLDMSKVDGFLRQLEANLSISEPAIATQIANIAFDIIKRWCPSPTSEFYQTRSSGNLRDSHEMTQLTASSWKIKPMAPYAAYVYFGHRLVPHGLVGVEIGRGHPHRGAVPWVPPRPWISDAKGYMDAQLKEIVAQAVRNLVSSSSGA